MLQRGLIATLAALTLALGLSAYRNVQAIESQAEVQELCAQIPNLLAAVEYTVTTYPSPVPDGSASSAVSDILFNLSYFTYAVANDGRWCEANSQQLHYDTARNTMLWHFGNASEYLARYQSMAGVPGAPELAEPATSTAVSTPTVPAQPTATPAPPTPTPTSQATATATVPTQTPAPPQPTATRHPASKLESARLLIKSGSSLCEYTREGRTSQATVKQGRFWTLLEWQGEGNISVRIRKDGVPHRVQPTKPDWNLEPSGGCNSIDLFEGVPATIWEVIFEPGNYTFEIWHLGGLIGTTDVEVVP